jgi:hypothetical protein
VRFVASAAHLPRLTKRFRLGGEAENGRGWDRTSDLPRVKYLLPTAGRGI